MRWITPRERAAWLLLSLSALSLVVLMLCLWGWIVVQGGPALSWEFLSKSPRKGMTEGGVLPAILGTVAATMITALFAVPVGVGAAIYLSEYAERNTLTRWIRLSIRNLSGVPSIVYGLFGIALFVNSANLGLSILASGLTLGLLTLPWTVTASEEAMRRVPQSYRDGAAALGATQWEGIRTVVLPAASPGIVTGAILGLARAAGETAPILFTGVTFFKPGLPESVFEQFMALPYHLYILSTQHHDIEAVRPLAYATALVLLLLITALMGVASNFRAKWTRLGAN